MGSNLATIAWFFDRPYESPAVALTQRARSFVLGEASYGLRAQGRLQDALPVMRTALSLIGEEQDWVSAALSASNLSETELLVGEVAVAVTTAAKARKFADRAGEVFYMVVSGTTQADALHAAGESGKAAGLFADAERRVRQVQSVYPLLYSLGGYRYCDLLLSSGRPGEARDRAAQTLERARHELGLLQVALDTLTLGRANLALALQSLASAPSSATARHDACAAAARLGDAVDGLRASGEFAWVTRGLLARAAFRRAAGDWDGAKRDLNEAKEIAEPGLMRLYCCDCALERARLALAQREAFAPLNGLVEPCPPPPVPPDPDAAAAVKEEARNQLDVARKLIAECGYHRRDEELAELDAVVAGGRRFADLPPRV